MRAAKPQRLVSYAEYLELEKRSDVRHEYWQGEMLAMAGGTGAHARVIQNLSYAVSRALDGRPCRPCPTDQRIRVGATGLSTYPDLSVVCGRRIPHPEDRHALTNPTAIFEVLSAGSSGYDWGEKFDHYAQLPSLQQYILVDSERVHVHVHTRHADGSWARRGYEAGTTVPIESVGATISVDDLYLGWAEERAIDMGTEAEPPR
jgi:Uma2 family endonuclease